MTGLLVAARFRGARACVLKPFAGLAGLRAHIPSRLVLAPQDIRTVDPTIADDIAAGHFAFAGRIVDARGQSPFAVPPPSLAWSQALMSFDWLRHLRGAGNGVRSRGTARALVDDWIKVAGDGRGPAWEPRVVARRLMAWLSQSPIILNDADWNFYNRFTRSVGRQTLYLEQALSGGLDGNARLSAAIALATVGLCADGLPALERRGTRLLGSELERQILPDGGHIGRNPRLLCDLLLDLLPLRQAYVGRGIQAPDALLNALDRMLPMLRLFRHTEGSLALFNGMGVTEPDVLATLLAYSDARAAATVSAPYSGYQRLCAGDSVLIADVGAAPPPVFSEEAHAGCLSFEFSCRSQRIIVNCGAPAQNRTDVRDAARATSMHSTLVLDDESSCTFVTEARARAWLGARVLSAPANVTHERADDVGGPYLRAQHDGYASAFGRLHERSFWLSADGNRLDGEDRMLLVPRKGAPVYAAECAIRFHLPPAVRLSPFGDGKAIELAVADGSVWDFEAGGLTVALEDSVFFAALDGLGRTRQMVVRPPPGSIEPVVWSLSRRPG